MKNLNCKSLKNSLSFLSIVFFSILLLSSCEQHKFLRERNLRKNLPPSKRELPVVIPNQSNGVYSIVGTNQKLYYNNNTEILALSADDLFFGQDASYESINPDYTDNENGTITDNNTGLMWQKDPGEKLTYDEAVAGISTFNLAGYTDWRLPAIKELYSLIIFSGQDPSGYNGSSTSNLIPFIDTDFFEFEYGNPNSGERIIDAQFATSTLDIGDSQFGGGDLMFGVNFADGRIKGYPTGPMPGQSQGKTFFVLYVRGNEAYGNNNFTDNDNETISDEATGLMWTQDDSNKGMTWKDGLEYAEGLEFAGYSDWRLPDIKELQRIVYYTRAPDATSSAAIDTVFNCTDIINEAGQIDYPYFWSSTTHANMNNGANAAYISFGRAMGKFNNQWMDVHGAGAQRSDPKIGNPDEYPNGHGPQGDAIRIYNYVRCVRNINSQN
ncbi:MAG: DUF1566 domain-containing protein [Mariniphaga sp.]|nr:DUF1566 domain-containing protein [Mariniphaga sp.]